MTLGEAVNYYHSLEKFGIMPGLERISLLSERLGSPHKKLKFIHVAGTNGKGSTCTALASVLHSAGYKTGLYTSPYVIDFRERIQLGMKMISPEDLISCTEKVKGAIEELSDEGVKITEFEAVTAAAFLFYAEKECDIVVLETGLGGRFDATNIIENPLCSIITSVSFDHIGVLGDTLGKIAFEKCGIIKKGCPVITGSEQPVEVLKVIKETAEEMKSPLILRDSEELFELVSESITGTVVDSSEGKFEIPFPGRHQLHNMSLVTGAVCVLREKGFDIGSEAVIRGTENARIPARIEVLSKNPLVILDGSHNDGSTAALGQLIKKHLEGKRILAVMGMMADKDIKKSLGNLIPFFSKVITVEPSNPRSMRSEELADIVGKFGIESISCKDPVQGVETAFSLLDGFDVLIVCGSLYLAGDVREKMLKICGERAALQ
ncbi:MAG: bifunctional folylpolyglutamate synthase/dihydrofolate synthase [Clostridia bacterium]|nr:bifunctional folylpolyglutamate synthase/dihydrofolate synthase [Clostridia bacterium]